MTGPGDIVLCSCYELGHQPYGLASPLGALRAAGFSPRCLDLAVEDLDDAALAMLARARLVAISVPMHTALRLGVALAARVRALAPDVRLCFYGLYAPLNAEYLRSLGADAVLGAEYEAELVALARGEAPAATATRALRRPAYARPARDGLPQLGRYARLVVEGLRGPGHEEKRLAGHTEASRGCLHMCRHCPIPPIYDGRFFAVPVDVVLADVAQQVAAGARHISFGDADFLNGPKHALAVARGLSAAHPEVTFDCTVKVEHILRHRHVWPELAALGCVFVVSAVESLSARILAILDKGHTRADVLEALALVRAAGISLRPTFLPFTPWTTVDDYLELCHFVLGHDLVAEVDPVQLSLRLLLPPGSLLLAHPDMAPHLGDLGALDQERLSFAWTHPDARMDRLQATVAALVEDAARRGEAAPATFARIHALAAAAAGRVVRPGATAPPRPAPPRLSESWFC
jgi:radical SAM superfamily enzyme YgiQ (UPF0313 family)